MSDFIPLPGHEPTADQWQRQYEHMKKERDQHSRRADMANERAERWQERYNDARRRLAEAWDEGYAAGHPEDPCSLHPANNPYRDAA